MRMWLLAYLLQLRPGEVDAELEVWMSRVETVYLVL